MKKITQFFTSLSVVLAMTMPTRAQSIFSLGDTIVFKLLPARWFFFDPSKESVQDTIVREWLIARRADGLVYWHKRPDVSVEIFDKQGFSTQEWRPAPPLPLFRVITRKNSFSYKTEDGRTLLSLPLTRKKAIRHFRFFYTAGGFTLRYVNDTLLRFGNKQVLTHKFVARDESVSNYNDRKDSLRHHTEYYFEVSTKLLLLKKEYTINSEYNKNTKSFTGLFITTPFPQAHKEELELIQQAIDRRLNRKRH